MNTTALLLMLFVHIPVTFLMVLFIYKLIKKDKK